jgi:hypothetical protein
MLAEYRGAAILLGADAHAPVLADSIQKLLKQRNAGEKLKLTAFKISHHASQNNLSSDLLKLLDCPSYLISTNGDHFCHPDRQAIARIIKYSSTQPAIYFNYRSAFNSVWERPNLQEQYHYVTQYPEGDRAGMNMSLLIQSSACVGPKKKAGGAQP